MSNYTTIVPVNMTDILVRIPVSSSPTWAAAIAAARSDERFALEELVSELGGAILSRNPVTVVAGSFARSW